MASHNPMQNYLPGDLAYGGRNYNDMPDEPRNHRSGHADTNPSHGPSPARSSEELESEVFEAAFVVCWPSEPHRPCIKGGCIFSVWDSSSANDWIIKNCYHPLLVLIFDSKIGGPIASMLSINSVALTLFGNMSVYLIKIAEALANLSGFPVIVRPLEEDPSSQFRNNEIFMGNALADGPDQADGNAMHGSTEQGANLAEGDSQGRTPHSTDNPRKRQEGDEDSESNDEGAPPPPPPPLPPDSKGVVHSADIHLTLLNDTRSPHFIRSITKVQLYPPNVKTETDNQMRTNMVYEIEGHIDLEIRKSNSTILRTEHFIPLGYSPPEHKFKRTMGEQRSTIFGGMLGLTGGKPTVSVNATKGKMTSSATEIADDEIAKQWLVYLQQMDCYWRSETSVYRGLNTMIRRYRVPIDIHASSIHVKYGIAVEVVDQITACVSFLSRHQIHCWVKSKSGVRGLIVLAANFIPDMCTNQPLWIEGRPTLDLNMNIREGGEGIGAGSEQDQRKHGTDEAENIGCTLPQQGTADGVTNEGLVPPLPLQPEDHFMFTGAALPHEAKNISRLKTWKKRLFKRNKEKEPVTLMARGREPLGWDHTNMEWYYPIWPELDDNLECASDGSRIRLRLDWSGHDLEASDKSATPQAGKDAQTIVD